MNKIKYQILWLIFFMACIDSKPVEVSKQTSLQNKEIEPPSFLNKWDKVFFDYFMDDESISIPSKILTKALVEYPNLMSKLPVDNEKVFRKNCDSEIDTNYRDLSDFQNLLFTYFLQQRHNTSEYQKIRIQLLQLFITINDIDKELDHGGTGYMHFYEEISAIVEFEIAKFDYNNSQNDRFEVEYTEEKQYYIRMLKVMLASRKEIDMEFSEEDKLDAFENISSLVNLLDRDITDGYLLNVVRRFQYSHCDQ